MRKVFSFCVAGALVVAGIYTAIAFGFGGSGDASTPAKFRGFIWMAIFTLSGLGAYWIWIDFIGPMFGRRSDE